ncbi:DUF1761 family protein [Streptosporangium sp. NPDC004379]|uniref:DUF1761 family protein n=1 Tax=Streptosporangium sp. NPDC004379 TaxID=3366189 RepID=UPI0036ACA55A
MPESLFLLVPVMTVTAFVLGGLYYAVLGGRVVTSAAPASPRTFAAEFGRCLALACAVTGLAVWTGTGTWTGGLLLGLVLWLGFPAVLWTGAILHENTPWRLAAAHAGDWLVKLPVLGAIAGARH